MSLVHVLKEPVTTAKIELADDKTIGEKRLARQAACSYEKRTKTRDPHLETSTESTTAYQI